MAKKNSKKKQDKSKSKKKKGKAGAVAGGYAARLTTQPLTINYPSGDTDCNNSDVMVNVTMTPPTVPAGATWSLDQVNSFVQIGTTKRSISSFTQSGDDYTDSITNFALPPGSYDITAEAHWIGTMPLTQVDSDGPIALNCLVPPSPPSPPSPPMVMVSGKPTAKATTKKSKKKSKK